MPKGTPEEKAARKAAMKAARKEVRAYKRLSEDISVCDFVIDEMNKYSTVRTQMQYDRYAALKAAGFEAIRSADKSLLKEAKDMPKSTHAERECRSDAMAFARQMLTCRKNMDKYFKNREVVVPDERVLEAAEALPEDTLVQRIQKKKAVKAFVNEKSQYVRAAKIMLDAERMITERKNFTHLDEIREKYMEAKAHADEAFAAKKAEVERLEAERKADMERRQQERMAKKGGSKK